MNMPCIPYDITLALAIQTYAAAALITLGHVLNQNGLNQNGYGYRTAERRRSRQEEEQRGGGAERREGRRWWHFVLS